MKHPKQNTNKEAKSLGMECELSDRGLPLTPRIQSQCHLPCPKSNSENEKCLHIQRHHELGMQIYFPRAGGVAQAIELLPSKREALSSNPNTAPPPKKSVL
jgi:hypothetical protein